MKRSVTIKENMMNFAGFIPRETLLSHRLLWRTAAKTAGHTIASVSQSAQRSDMPSCAIVHGAVCVSCSA